MTGGQSGHWTGDDDARVRLSVPPGTHGRVPVPAQCGVAVTGATQQLLANAWEHQAFLANIRGVPVEPARRPHPGERMARSMAMGRCVVDVLNDDEILRHADALPDQLQLPAGRPAFVMTTNERGWPRQRPEEVGVSKGGGHPSGTLSVRLKTHAALTTPTKKRRSPTYKPGCAGLGCFVAGVSCSCLQPATKQQRSKKKARIAWVAAHTTR